MIDISVRKAIKDVKREFGDLTPQQIRRGIARAINHTIGITKTQANREIRNTYKLPAKTIRDSMSIRKANAAQVSQFAMLLARGRPIPLIYFGARQTRKGVTINVMGQRKLINGAFIATMKSGHRGVFGRGAYGSSSFVFRNRRLRKSGNDLSITEMNTLSVPAAMRTNPVITALSRNITERFPQRLTHELMRLRGAGSSVGDSAG